MNPPPPSIACFGAAHWDYIGQTWAGYVGPDRPGTIVRRPGGVAANVAIGLAQQGVHATLMTAIGSDGDGVELVATLRSLGVDTSCVSVSGSMPTGRYLAVEDADGELMAAVADCQALDALTPGSFETTAVAGAGFWFIETNLPQAVLDHLAGLTAHPFLVANPVSPARADKFRPLLSDIGILYCNRTEAEVLCETPFKSSCEAARALLRKGVSRAVVTDGPGSVCDASPDGIFSADPTISGFRSATGAGDAFLSRHLGTVIAGARPEAALRTALNSSPSSKGREQR